MKRLRLMRAVLVAAAALFGASALLQAPVLADTPDFCPKRPLPPALQDVCRACPTYVDPVVCPVVCVNGVQEKTFTNQCFANCSGYIFTGPCSKTGS